MYCTLSRDGVSHLYYINHVQGLNLLVNGSFFKKKLVIHEKKKKKTFLGLYTKTHIWACIRLAKRGGLARTRNGLKAQF